MADRSRTQGGRSRGRAKGKTTTPAMPSTQATMASALVATPPPSSSKPSTSSVPQTSSMPPLGSNPPLAIAQPQGRATGRLPGPTRRPESSGDGTTPSVSTITRKMGAMDVKEPPVQMGRGGVRGRRDMSALLHTKPGHITNKLGDTGIKIRLQANYFKLIKQTDWCLYQYRVDFEPEEDRTFIKKKLMYPHKDKFGGFLFDGNTLWTTCLLRPDPMELFSKRESDDQKMRIIIKKTVDLSVGDPAYIQLFNVITRKCLEYLDLQLVGRDYFCPKEKVSLRELKMELWPGYSTSIRQHEDSILMNTEITHKVMRQDTAYALMDECKNRASGRESFQNLYRSSIVGSIVMTKYNQKTYRIDDVDFSQSPSSTFDMKGKKVSYFEYYKQRYNEIIRYGDQPMLISRSKPRDIRAGMAEIIVLVPELCHTTGLTDEMRADVKLMRALADHTRIPPKARMDKLRTFLTKLQKNERVQEEFHTWNLKLDKDLVEFSGRLLPSEVIVFGGESRVKTNDSADWSGALRNNTMLNNTNLENWVIICLSKLRRDAQNFAQTLNRAARTFRFNIPQPRMEDITDDRSGTYCDTIDRVVSQLNPQLIMIIVPNNKAERYEAIKKRTCVDRCVPTQVVLAKNVNPQNRGIMSIATKIAIQLNCKLGGAPWSVDIPLSGVMVVGFDTTHDTATKSKSFGATVCSLNKYLTHYYSCVSQHSSGEELSNQIAIHIANGCIKYRDVNGSLPAKIFIYRDGVGEGQLTYVYQHEIQEIRDKLKGVYADQEPRLSVIVVSKRINTRLFYNGENPPPGSVADDVVTCPERYDFFLVSQSVKQGTVSPTSYNIIYDSSGLKADQMQRFSYKLTHLYYNWSGTVRVPAPCQYAHKLAMLVGQSLHTRPNPGFSNRLYFL